MVPIKTILCAVDFSEMTPIVAEHAAYMARQHGARLAVVYIAPKLNQYAQLYVGEGEIEVVVKSIQTGAEDKMKVLLREHFADMQATGKVIMGYPSEGIVQAARDEDAQLIVMGTHGRKGVDRILFGSVAEKVVKTSPVPVLTVRPTAN